MKKHQHLTVLRIVQLFALLCLLAVQCFAQMTVSSFNPHNGTGNPQNFVIVATDPAGFNNCQYLWMRFGEIVGGFNVLFECQTNTVRVLSDDGNSWGPVYTIGSSGVAQNSQGSIDIQTASKGGFGNFPSAAVTITFKPAFAGARSMYAIEYGLNGSNTGWVSFGTWTGSAAAPPTLDSITPSSGTASTQTFQITGSSAAGYSDIVYLRLKIGDEVNGVNLLFDRAAGKVALLNDAASSWGTWGNASTGGSVENSQAIVNFSSHGQALGGNSMTGTITVTFKPAFAGARTVNGIIYSNSLNSGWVNKGTWTVPTMPTDEIIAYGKESPATLNPGEVGMSRVTLSQAGQDIDPLALRVYHVNDPVTFRIRFGRPNQQVWVQRRAMSFVDGAWVNETLCSPTIGIGGHEQEGACLLGSTDSNGFFQWSGTILNSLIGMTTVEFYLGAQTPDPAYPMTTYGPMNQDNAIGALVYFVIGTSGFPQPPVW